MSMIKNISAIWLLAIFASPACAQEIDFNRDIRPILSRHCLACHGPDEGSRESDLRLDLRDDALAVIEPGDPDSSEAFLRITADDERMPPAEHGDSLTDKEINLFKEWIKQGANYQIHWSFVAPQKPELPSLEPALNSWARNEVDRFVAGKLSTLKLTPSPDADPRRLIRRVALDLTGLPPSLEMVQRFVDSPTDETYASIIDELLASPRYGEHWTAMWLDIARYADTIGYAEDKHRDIWPWRDWVINAFNSNMPYDQFTIEQIAGDLLPNATVDQKLATAFHRNTLNNSEGGTSDEEFRTIAVKDRISTTVNAWMGLTLRCAECHTHKYDPISQTEYYQFLDFFNQTVDADNNDERPRLDVYPAGREVEFAILDQRMNAINREIETAKPVWHVQSPLAASSRDGATLEIQPDGSIVAKGIKPDFDEYTLSFEVAAGTYTGLRLEVFPSPENNGNVGRAPEGAFVLSQVRASVGNDDNESQLKFSQATADHQQVNYGIEHIIRDTLDEKGWAVNHPQEGYRVTRIGVLTFETPLTVDETTKLKFVMTFKSPWNQQTIGQFRVSTTDVESPAEKFKQKKLEPLRRKLEEVVQERNAPIRVPVMEERKPEHLRETHVMTRGSYLQPAEQVSAAVFEAFPALPAGATKDRLGVAQWLVSDENPLTARVTVNRFWARIFGQGIVETEEDFGTQGTPPTDQALLDWLAVDFRDHHWDVKRLLKTIVTSSTYRQTNLATEDRLQLDPRNSYFSRGPRFRMRAEVIRDQALAVTGLLSDKMFGPPVYPPNPVKIVRSAFTGGTTWVESEGEDRYRRAIYTYLKRTSPHPLFETFDMATREVCNMRRIRTNTPLQSFMTLNDRTFIEAAQMLAVKMYLHANEDEARIKHGIELAFLRPGSDDQVAALLKLHLTTRTRYAEIPDQAIEMIDAMGSFGIEEATLQKDAAELASLTVVANVILNLDAFLTK